VLVTTIAFDGTSVAADTLGIDFGNKLQRPVTKILHREGYVFAGAGNAALVEPYAKWFLGGADPASLPPGGDNDRYTLHLLVIDLIKGAHLCFAPLPLVPHPNEVKPPFALGSGMDFALTAMLCGKDARGAVEIAMMLDPNSGGEVTVVNIADLKRAARSPRRNGKIEAAPCA
jgi:hypothetical protein